MTNRRLTQPKITSRRLTPTQIAREVREEPLAGNIDELSPFIGKVEVSGANLNGPNVKK
jgi:hypothetical protein